MDVESNYEIDRTANYIFSRKFTRVALQFPDELLKDATKVVRALRQKLRELGECDEKSDREGREVGLFVMADTTYGSCCVDEVGASHINAECVIHYGHTCLSPTSTLPAFFVFGKASISVSNCAETICEFASSHDKPILILFGLEYAHAMQDIQETVVAETSKLWRSTSKPNILYAEVLCSTKDPLKDHVIPNGQAEIVGGHKANGKCNAEGETGAGIRYCIGGLTWILLNGYRIEDFLLFWIGPDNSAFTNVVLRFNDCEIVRYDAAEKCLVTDLSQQKGFLREAGYLPMIYQMKELITRAGKKAYTLVMGRPNPAKLANFPECDIFVFVSCEQTALLDSKEFLAPVITPFEAMLAFSRGSQWTGAYTMEFGSLINLPFESQAYSNEARFSFFQGGYVEEQDEKDKSDDQEEVSALAVATEKTLQVRNKSPNFLVKGTAKSGAEYLAARSYQGLGAHDDDSLPMPFLIGRTGKASGYEDEKR